MVEAMVSALVFNNCPESSIVIDEITGIIPLDNKKNKKSVLTETISPTNP